MLNPSLLVEVTSDSTEDYDRGTKFLHYQAIASLQEYVIVSHREHRVDHFRRLENGQWLNTTWRDEAKVDLPLVGGAFEMSDCMRESYSTRDECVGDPANAPFSTLDELERA